MPQIRLTLEYDGTDYVGWQFQTNGRSVQEEIEKAIKQILQVDLRITGGGRTDAGAHARGQVASFFIDREVEISSLQKSLNSVLPRDIVVRSSSLVPMDFNARYSAKSRRYRYYISPNPTAIQRHYCWHVFFRLDFKLLKQCAEKIIGEHDFQSFSKLNTDSKHYRCIVSKADWCENNEMLEFEITANRFLYGMVRALVGTMVNVGKGSNTVIDFGTILEAKKRAAAGISAPAKGLFLEEIIY
jgi:tRNA pseudouridine38-40 synthase